MPQLRNRGLRVALATLAGGSLALTACPVPRPQAADGGLLAKGGSSLVRITDEPPGERCPPGGIRIEVGVDDDGDGALDDGEVDGEPSFVCDGEEGGAPPAGLVSVREEAPGDRCQHGGQRVDAGRDLDGDGLLDEDEIESTGYACAGAPGTSGGTALVEVSDAGAACASGGVLLEAGIDRDDNGALDDDEIAVSRAVCGGVPGADADAGAEGGAALVDLVEEPAGVACAAGGQRVLVGHDDDGDGVLDAEEVEEAALVCNGLDGGDAPVEGPGAGTSEGSAAAPALLEVTTFEGGAEPRLATVAAGGTSFYTFTAASAEDPAIGLAPHTIGLFGAESSLEVSLYGDADFSSSPIAVACFDIDAAGAARACRTAPLERGRAYYLTLRDRANLPSSLFVSVSFGADEGAPGSPVSVDVASAAPGAVRGGGRSLYAFSAATPGPHTVSLENATGEAGGLPPGLSWSLYEGEVRPDRLVWSCPVGAAGGDTRCATPALSAGTLYVVEVSSVGSSGGVFDLVISEGDAVTLQVALGGQVVVPGLAPGLAVFQFVSTDAGRYTVDTFHAASTWRLYRDLAAVEAGELLFICYDRACATPSLEASTSYYLEINQSATGPTDVALTVVPRGGAEGSFDAPADLALDAQHLGSIAHPPENASFYRFTTTIGGPYTARFAFDSPDYPPSCRFYSDPGFAAPVSLSQTLNNDGTCISEGLDAGVTYYLKVSGNMASTYALTIEAGDAVTPAFPVGGGPVVIDLPANQEVLLQLPTTTAPYRLSFTGATGGLQRRVWGAHPRNRASAGYVARCEASPAGFDANDCVVEAALAEGVSYVQLVERSGAANQVTVELTEVTTVEAMAGVASTTGVLAPGERRWFRFTNAAEGFYEAILARQSGGHFLFELYDPGRALYDNGLYGGGGAQTFTDDKLSPTLYAEPLPAQTWLAAIVNDGTAELVVDVTLREKP